MADTLFMPSGSETKKVLERIRRERGGIPTPGGSHSRSRWVLWGLTLLVAAAAVMWTIRAGRALSHTYDEPHHLATGLEWWQFGSYRWWTENPPLPKIAIALGPHLAGLRLPDKATLDIANRSNHPWKAGADLLYQDGNYQRWLNLARLGTLPFLVLTLLLTFLLAGGPRRPLVGLIATALVATYPPLLGHAALATTDVAAVATTLLFLYCLDRWWSQRRLWRAALIGAAFGLALLCKLTAPLLCGVVAVGWLIGRRVFGKATSSNPPEPDSPPGPASRPASTSKRAASSMRASSPVRAAIPRVVRKPVEWPRRGSRSAPRAHPARGAILTGLVALSAAFLVVWAGYRFSVGRIDDMSPLGFMRTQVLPAIGDRPAWLAWLCQLPLPAPEIPHGYLFLKSHSSHGHLAYLFGKVNDHGFWNFYLVGLLFKSPFPFLLLAVAAVLVLVRLAGRGVGVASAGAGAGLAALAAMALSTASTVNIGLRHFLVVVPLAAIWIATALGALVEAAPGRFFPRLAMGSIALLLVGQAVIVERAEPELMAYFNPLAGDEPGEALIDSDLDWGQDFLLLKREIASRKISSLRLALFGTVRPCSTDMPTLLPLVPRQPASGWIAISENYYRAADLIGLRRDPCDPSSAYGFHEAPADGFTWLRAHAATRIGASLRLYHIADTPAASDPPPPASDDWQAAPAPAPADKTVAVPVPKKKRKVRSKGSR